jgi:hypothetical protein
MTIIWLRLYLSISFGSQFPIKFDTPDRRSDSESTSWLAEFTYAYVATVVWLWSGTTTRTRSWRCTKKPAARGRLQTKAPCTGVALALLQHTTSCVTARATNRQPTRGRGGGVTWSLSLFCVCWPRPAFHTCFQFCPPCHAGRRDKNGRSFVLAFDLTGSSCTLCGQFQTWWSPLAARRWV